MILCGLLLPLGGYLLLLAWLNSRRRPVLVHGVDDGIGLLMGLSGFLLLGGPLVLGRVVDRLRISALASTSSPLLTPSQASFLLAFLYCLAVVFAAIYLFARQRQVTCLYNTDLELVEDTLEEIFTEQGLDPLRSEQIYFFRQRGNTSSESPQDGPIGSLELEVVAAFHHVTLRWEPSTNPVRPQVEAVLAKRLRETESNGNDLSFWLALGGVFLLGLCGMALGLDLARNWY